MSVGKKGIATGKSLSVIGVMLAIFIVLMLASLVYVGDKRATLQRHVTIL